MSDGNHYIVEVDQTAPATRVIVAKTRNGALQFVAQGIISVRLATARDMYEARGNEIPIEDATAAPDPSDAGQAALRG